MPLIFDIYWFALAWNISLHVLTGKECDTESGLDFILAWYYSGAHVRFTSPNEFSEGQMISLSSADAHIRGFKFPRTYSKRITSRKETPDTMNRFIPWQLEGAMNSRSGYGSAGQAQKLLSNWASLIKGLWLPREINSREILVWDKFF